MSLSQLKSVASPSTLVLVAIMLSCTGFSAPSLPKSLRILSSSGPIPSTEKARVKDLILAAKGARLFDRKYFEGRSNDANDAGLSRRVRAEPARSMSVKVKPDRED